MIARLSVCNVQYALHTMHIFTQQQVVCKPTMQCLSVTALYNPEGTTLKVVYVQRCQRKSTSDAPDVPCHLSTCALMPVSPMPCRP